MELSLKELNQNNNLELWSNRVQECRNSGLPVRTWCSRNNICASTYYFWQRKLFKAVTATHGAEVGKIESSSVDFVEVPNKVTPPESSQVLAATLVVGETSLDIYNNIRPELLTVLLKGLKSC